MNRSGPIGKLTNRALLGVCILGLAMSIYGWTLPVYYDYEAARLLKLNACDQSGVIAGWFARMDALKTPRYQFMQGGISIVLAALTWKAFMSRFPGVSPWLPRSPRRKATYFVMGVGLLIAGWLAQVFSLDLDMHRGEFPWCADSMGIPLSGLTALFLLLLIVSIASGGVMALGFGSLPSELNQWDRQRPLWSWAVSLSLLPVFVIVCMITVQSGVESAFLSVPSGIAALYLIAATRAALISPRVPEPLR